MISIDALSHDESGLTFYTRIPDDDLSIKSLSFTIKKVSSEIINHAMETVDSLGPSVHTYEQQ